MPNQNNQAHNQADGKFDPNVKLNRAEEEVKENEEASLQDDSYSFDEDNTGSEDFHDASSIEDDDFEGDDYIQ